MSLPSWSLVQKVCGSSRQHFNHSIFSIATGHLLEFQETKPPNSRRVFQGTCNSANNFTARHGHPTPSRIICVRDCEAVPVAENDFKRIVRQRPLNQVRHHERIFAAAERHIKQTAHDVFQNLQIKQTAALRFGNKLPAIKVRRPCAQQSGSLACGNRPFRCPIRNRT